MTLAERAQRVRLLLESLNDPYPTPRGALRPDSGPAPSRYIPCETCRSTGRVRARGGFVVCLVCDGRGEHRRARGAPAWDAYLRLPLAEAAELPREPSPARLMPGDDDAYPWERAKKVHERHGSYAELRRQLSWLARAYPRRYRLVQICLVEHQARELSPSAKLELELGVVALALRMRSPRVPGWLLERSAAAERRHTLAGLAALGLQAGEIARTLGMRKRTVQRRLKELDSRVAGAPVRAA